MELIREEFRPRYDILKERRQKGLITDAIYRAKVEELTNEESQRKLDTELTIGELEQHIEEEL